MIGKSIMMSIHGRNWMPTLKKQRSWLASTSHGQPRTRMADLSTKEKYLNKYFCIYKLIIFNNIKKRNNCLFHIFPSFI